MNHPEFNSEDDFENSPDSNSTGVAIDKKHAYKTVVIKPSNLKDPSPIERVSTEEPSPSKVISSKGSSMKESQVGDSKAEHPTPAKDINPAKNVDKINNLVQKESALGKVGVTREKAYAVIARALDAKKWMDVCDEQGNIRRELVDDLEKQKWGAEMAIKMFGDMIERKEIEHDLGDKTLDRLRALSVVELKARAADILLGKRIGTVVDAEVI